MSPSNALDIAAMLPTNVSRIATMGGKLEKVDKIRGFLGRVAVPSEADSMSDITTNSILEN